MEIPFLQLTIPPHTLMILVSVAICLWLVPRWAESLEGIDRSRMRRAVIGVGLVVLVGGQLHFVLSNWHFVGGSVRSVLRIWPLSLHAGGAIAALAIGTPLLLRFFGIPAGKFADGITPSVGIGIAIARVGCLLQGCCFGTVSHWPWAISFPPSAYVYQRHSTLGLLPDDALRSAPIHPLQIYFSAAGLLLTAVALWMYPRKRYDGQVGLVVLLVYGATSAALEFVRADYYPRTYWGPFAQLQLVALALAVAAAVALGVGEVVRRRRTHKTPASNAAVE